MEYGLIGETLKHSYSAEIHNLIGNYSYELREVPKEGLLDFMLKRDFKAINVTIPYKQAVIPFLDFIDPAAKELGAVNTVVNRDGKLFGYNTDFIGLIDMLNEAGIKLNGKKVLIIGTGGTAKTAGAVSKFLGSRETVFVSRSVKPDFDGNAVSREEAVSKHRDAEIIINATPCGMFPKTEDKPLSLKFFPELEGLADVIYNPIRTNLVMEAQSLGIRCCSGLFMLVRQALSSAEFFFDRKFGKNEATSIYSKMLYAKRNIILIGMPGSGKTTAGKILAQKLGKPFFDTDALIEEKTGVSIPCFIRENGEPAFRTLESEVCEGLASAAGCVIATGGGVILSENNIRNLKRNGLVFFLDRALEYIVPTEDRPLSNSFDSLKKLYEKRYPLYVSMSDIRIASDENPEHTVFSVISGFRGALL